MLNSHRKCTLFSDRNFTINARIPTFRGYFGGLQSVYYVVIDFLVDHGE